MPSRHTSRPIESVDFLIVTALPVERDAVLRLLESEPLQQEGSPTYYLATIQAAAHDGTYTVAVTMLPEMGNIEAAQRTGQAIYDLAPAYVLMVGIAGGVQGRVNLGDVIVSTQIVYYEPAKMTPTGNALRPSSVLTDRLLLDRAQNYQEPSWRDLISVPRPSRRGRKTARAEQSEVSFGAIAVGEKVIADQLAMDQLASIHAKFIGVEMESYGVALAAASSAHRPRCLTIRGVCDFADASKNDTWHRYAAESAAAFTVGFLRCGPVAPRSMHQAQSPAKRFLIVIRHQSMERFPNLAIASVLPSEYHTDYAVEIDLDQSDVYEDGRLTDPLEAARRQANLEERVNALLATHPDADIAYYAIAHIPLLFLAGYSLSSKRAILLFDFNRHARVWNQLHLGEDIPTLEMMGLPSRTRRTTGDVVVRVSISYLVTEDDIAGIVFRPIASLHMKLAQPRLDVVTNEQQVRVYGQHFRELLDTIHERLPNTTCIHLFYAGPPPVAFHFGQLISKTIHPRVVVYNYVARDVPRYSWGLDITAPVQADGFLVRPNTKENRNDV
jgi:nucleoside phosphorylase